MIKLDALATARSIDTFTRASGISVLTGAKGANARARSAVLLWIRNDERISAIAVFRSIRTFEVNADMTLIL